MRSNHTRAANGAKPAVRSDEIQNQILALTRRDLQLWSIAVLVILVLAGGFVALVTPNLVWTTGAFRIESRYLPQLFFGIISLILLFNIYIISQKRELNATRKALVQELMSNQRLVDFSLMDHQTQLFNRHALDQVLSKEVARVNRRGDPLTLLLVSVDDLSGVEDRSGQQARHHLLLGAAELLRTTFRGSDMAFRYADDEFLVLMPETNERQAEFALTRLRHELERWNLENGSETQLSLSWGMATYVGGAMIADVLESAKRKLFLKRQKLVPVF